jgi:hypothetical protein
MQRSAMAALALLLAPLARAQEPPKPTPPPKVEEKAEAGITSPKYENTDLGITFSGVYGWVSRFAAGSGAWNELARYESDAQNDAFVQLLVRENPHSAVGEMRQAITEEFKETAEPTKGRPAFKEVVVRDADMKRGINLPGVEVECVAVEVAEDGKKRERSLMVRTYYGENRLYRVFCSVRRARAKKVRDLFERAVSGLTVDAVEERTARGFAFRSVQGSYACVVPDGFTVVRPPDAWVADAKFENRQGIVISVVSAPYEGLLMDQVQELNDYYRDAIRIDSEDVKLLGGDGFVATVTKPESVTLITGVIRDRRVYRIHTSAPPKRVDQAKQVHETFLKGFRIGRQA